MTGTICSMLLKGESIESALSYGILASRMTVESEGKVSAISEELSFEGLEKLMKEEKVKHVV